MPVIIPHQLPAATILANEGIQTYREAPAPAGARPLKICILNLMPDKVTTEAQLLRKLSTHSLAIEITLLSVETYQAKHTSPSYLRRFYRYFSEVKAQHFDAMIVTGAPIEHLHFTDVSYWQELSKILDWSQTHVNNSLFICWGCQAALYHFYGIEKRAFSHKLFGVFPHQKECARDPLFSDIEETFYVPHSRHTESDPAQIRAHQNLAVLASSQQAGIHLVASQDRRQLFMSGHPEYDKETLQKEYLRDSDKADVRLPENYFIDDDPTLGVIPRWQTPASRFYDNWLQHYVRGN